MTNKPKESISELLDLFKTQFNEDMKTLNPLIEYEILVLELENAVKEYPNYSVLGSEVKKIITNFREKK